MSKDGKRKYLLRWVQSRCEKAGSWGKFKTKWKELNLAMATHYPNDVTRRWKAFAAATESYPETELMAGLDSWNLRITQQRERTQEGTMSASTANIVEKLANIDLLRATETAKAHLETAAKADRDERRLQRELELEEKKIEARKIEAASRVEIAKQKAERPEGRASAVKEEKELAMQLLPVTVVDDGTVNLVRDIAFVYSHLNELISISPTGLRILDLAVLATAPSNGAINLAAYALSDLSGFFTKFVVRLLPRDLSESEELGGKAKEAESMDPGLEDLQRYLEPKGKEKTDEGEDSEQDEEEDEKGMAG